jgi:hypothetical protein
MGRIELTGEALQYLFYAVTLAALVPLVAVLVWPFDSLANITVAVLMLSLAIASVVGLWRRKTGREPQHLGTDEDIAWDPVAYPGQAAKERWMKAVRRLPGNDDEDD